MLATAALALVALGASTQEWLHVALVGGAEHSVTGSDAVPVLAPLSLSVVALVAAASLARRVTLTVFGALLILLGAAMAVASFGVLSSPVAASGSVISTATGVSGDTAIAALVASTAATGWLFACGTAAVAVAACGVLVVVRARAWSRHVSSKARTLSQHPADDALGAWDTLSRGVDPTDEKPGR